MESTRDIVVIIFGVTGTVASGMLVIMIFKLYGRTCEALERVGRASNDIHDAAEGVRSGARVAKEALTVVGSAVPGSNWSRMAYRTAMVIPRAVRLFSRFKKPPASGGR